MDPFTLKVLVFGGLLTWWLGPRLLQTARPPADSEHFLGVGLRKAPMPTPKVPTAADEEHALEVLQARLIAKGLPFDQVQAALVPIRNRLA